MTARRPHSRGFTLIELAVTIAVMFIFFMMAFPSFASLKQRSAIRGAGDQVLGFWNEARFEAVKRNQLVKVGFMRVGVSGFCIGAATTTSESDSSACDCSSAAPATNVCDVGRYPSDQTEWQRVTLVGASLGGSTGVTNLRAVVIEPKSTTLTEPGDVGAISLASPPGQVAYTLNLRVDTLGRGLLCESSSSTAQLPEYNARRCAD
jgi:prepilin-type N-terminal cleavage/methylation domain-containing protein